jgi:hypothetical protein
MSGQFQVDVDALKTFSKQIQQLATNIGNDASVKACFQGLAPSPYTPVNGPSNFPSGKLEFGNDPSLDFIQGEEFWKYYNAQYDGFTSNFAAFLNALIVLGEAAATIAGNYENATSYDQVGQQDVQNAIANAPPPGQTQTTTQTH